jgi:hypothetical protein
MQDGALASDELTGRMRHATWMEVEVEVEEEVEEVEEGAGEAAPLSTERWTLLISRCLIPTL